MTKFFLLTGMYAAALILEIAVIPNFFLWDIPLGAVFFCISLYWLEGPAAAVYAAASGLLYSALHSTAPGAVFVFLALALAAALFKKIFTHYGPLHLLMFLGVIFALRQLFDVVWMLFAGLEEFGLRPFVSGIRLIDLMFSVAAFLFVALVLFVRQIRGRRLDRLSV